MNAEDPFRPLEPPAGGAQRFAQRLEAAASTTPASARRRTLAWAAAAAAAGAIVLVALVPREPDVGPPPSLVADTQLRLEIYESPAFDRLLGRPLRAEPLTATLNRQSVAVTEVDSQNEKVRIYRIER